DSRIVRNIVAAALQFPTPSQDRLMAALNGDFQAFLSTDPANPGLLVRDLNAQDPARDNSEGLFSVPICTRFAHRSGPREFIHETVAAGYPLTVKTGAFVTRVLFQGADVSNKLSGPFGYIFAADQAQGPPRAIGVEYLDHPHLYQADPNATAPDASVPRV